MKKVYNLSAEYTFTVVKEIEAESYEHALSILDCMSLEELNRDAEYLDASFENNVQMNMVLNEDNEITLSEIEEYHGTKL